MPPRLQPRCMIMPAGDPCTMLSLYLARWIFLRFLSLSPSLSLSPALSCSALSLTLSALSLSIALSISLSISGSLSRPLPGARRPQQQPSDACRAFIFLLTPPDASPTPGKGICTMQKEKEKMDEQNSKANDIDGQKGQLVQEEEREKGKVGLSVYWKYITTSYKGALVPFILLARILFQILQIGSNYWMAWATPVSKNVTPPVKASLLILVYVSFAVGSSFCILLRALLLVTAGYKTTTILFNKLHMCIFCAPMSFFDATTSGRILNRASTDQSAVDTSLPFQMGFVAFSVIQLLGIIAVMSQVA